MGSEEHPRLWRRPLLSSAVLFAVGLIDVMHESLEAPLLALRASSFGARSDASSFTLETPFGRSLIPRLRQQTIGNLLFFFFHNFSDDILDHIHLSLAKFQKPIIIYATFDLGNYLMPSVNI